MFLLNKKKATEFLEEIEKRWNLLRKELETVTNNYVDLRSAVEEMDLFMREIVNRTILLLQEMHEAISKLEEKASELESLVGRSPSPINQQRPLPPPTQPTPQPTTQQLPPPPTKQQPSTPQSRPLPQPPPVNPRQEMLQQLRALFQKKQKKG